MFGRNLLPIYTRMTEDALSQAMALHDEGDLDAAARVYDAILELSPDHDLCYYLLGEIDFRLHRYEDACDRFARAIDLNPVVPFYHYYQGKARIRLGRPDLAIQDFRRAIILKPTHSEFWEELVQVLLETEARQDALAAAEDYRAQFPADARARNLAGLVLQAMGREDEARACYDAALRLDSQMPEALNNLAALELNSGGLAEAEALFRKAIRVAPDFAQCMGNLGDCLRRQGKFAEAHRVITCALELDPLNHGSHLHLGAVLYYRGDIEEASAAFLRSMELNGDIHQAQSNYLYTLCYLGNDNPEQVRDAHLRWASQCEQSVTRIRSRPLCCDGRRLRIGYLSSDFKTHSVSHFIRGPFSEHDTERFEVFAYSNVCNPDAVTQRLKDSVEHWVDVHALTDEDLAEQIEKDGIDILLDLGGHTASNRLRVFAMKPAPVQISHIGYPNTTGLSTIDYRIVDAHTDPEGIADSLHSETLLRMPGCFLNFTPPKGLEAGLPAPFEENGYITFGSFNNLPKLNDSTFKAWSDILERVPRSRLIVKSLALTDESVKEQFCNKLLDAGISRERIELIAWQPSARNHFDVLRRADIALDSFPYHGTTTTCELLAAGVPVVVRAGATHLSRVGVSLLENIGHPELIAGSREDYIAKAVSLAGNPERLIRYRKDLGLSVARSRLCDSKAYTRDLEGLYLRVASAAGQGMEECA